VISTSVGFCVCIVYGYKKLGHAVVKYVHFWSIFSILYIAGHKISFEIFPVVCSAEPYSNIILQN